MTADTYIASVKRKNAALFACAKLTMTPASLEAQLRAAFDAGNSSGHDRGFKAATDIGKLGGTKTPSIDALFDKMFK